MSKFILIVAALFCLATLAAGQTSTKTQIATVFYTGTTDICVVGGANVTSYADAGKCTGAGSSYTASYCSNDGAFVYTFSYSDSSCNSSFATSVSQIPTSCGFLSKSLQYQCVNPTLGPAAPLSFPPTNWVQSTSCKNATNDYKAATVCVAGSDAAIKCTQSASAPTAACAKSLLPGLGSVSSGCSADGTNVVSVYYTDDKCATVGLAYVSAVGCYNGVKTSCSANAVPALPNKGFTTYLDAACGATAGSAPITTLFADGCVNSQSFACSTVNSTTAGTYTTFTDSTFKGLCPADKSTSIVQPVGVCRAGKIFTCNFSPIVPGNAASATGASMVAMIVAAIVALVASLSL